MDVKSGDWVIVHNIILNEKQRAAQVPEDTKKCPLEMWVKGFIQNDSNIGDLVTIKTITGRMVKGKLIEKNPTYNHDYGKCIPELLQIGIQAREILFGGDKDAK